MKIQNRDRKNRIFSIDVTFDEMYIIKKLAENYEGDDLDIAIIGNIADVTEKALWNLTDTKAEWVK